MPRFDSVSTTVAFIHRSVSHDYPKQRVSILIAATNETVNKLIILRSHSLAWLDPTLPIYRRGFRIRVADIFKFCIKHIASDTIYKRKKRRGTEFVELWRVLD